MKITKQWLKKKNACQDGYEWFLNQKETDCGKVMLKLTKLGRLEDALWLVEQLANKKQAVRLAVFSAKLCIKEFEKARPDDDRPRKAIEAAEAYIKNPCEKTKSAAMSAAHAAWSTEACVEGSAARSATCAGWSAGWSAGWFAGCAVWSAAESTGGNKTQIAIIKEAIKILEI